MHFTEKYCQTFGKKLAITVSPKFHQIPSISILWFDTVVEAKHPQPYDVVKR